MDEPWGNLNCGNGAFMPCGEQSVGDFIYGASYNDILCTEFDFFPLKAQCFLAEVIWEELWKYVSQKIAAEEIQTNSQR
jgi:hypothetical protein